MSFSIDDVKLGGWIRGPELPDSYRAQFGSNLSLPKQVDLRPHCTPVENQGHLNSCTANAAVGALEYHYRRYRDMPVDLSRLFVYYNTRRLNGTLQQDMGATIPESMASILAYGACQEANWPYDPARIAMEPPQGAYLEGKSFEAVQYARVPGAQGAQVALAQDLPVSFGIWLPRRCYEEATTTGRIPDLTQAEKQAPPSGGHAMLIVGYNDDEQTFLVRNSWGSEWGEGGYCHISYRTMAERSAPDQFWVLAQPEQPGNFSIIKPETSATPATSSQAETGSVQGGFAETATRLREEIRTDLQSEFTAAGKKVDDLIRRQQEPPAGPSDSGRMGTDCSMCGGYRTCYYCDGTGKVYGEICAQCAGNGRCQACLYY